MQNKIFNYNRSQKSPKHMEVEINAFLSQVVFKYAVQNEAPNTGRVMLSVLYEEISKKQKSNIQVSVVRSANIREAEENIDKVLKVIDGKVTMMTQTFSANTIMTIIFHEGKALDTKEKQDKN